MNIVLLLNSVGRLFCTYAVSIQYTLTTWPLTRCTLRMDGWLCIWTIVALQNFSLTNQIRNNKKMINNVYDYGLKNTFTVI